MTMTDWATRKIAIDVIYTMAAILKNALSPFKKDILEVLSHARVDKIKHVREATLEAISAVKEIPDDEDNTSINILSKNTTKRERSP